MGESVCEVVSVDEDEICVSLFFSCVQDARFCLNSSVGFPGFKPRLMQAIWSSACDRSARPSLSSNKSSVVISCALLFNRILSPALGMTL